MTKRKILIAAVVLLSLVLVAVILAALLLGRTPQGDAPAETTETVPETTTLPPPTENVFTPMDFAYEGEYLTCLTDESYLGVDVSSYPKAVDWQ